MHPAAALDRLLERSGLEAFAVGRSSFRLEPARHVAPIAPPVAQPAPIADIVVTGVKRGQPLGRLPVSVAIVALGDNWRMPPLAQGGDVAANVEGLTVTNLGPGRNRQFIRGVADSPFSGTSQSTVAIQFDEARLAYNAPDPDLRLVDVDRVEILKGPQGTLYGAGALGGVYHIIPHRADLDNASGFSEIHGTSLASGGFGGGGQAVINLPLAADRLAIRAVGYAEQEPGWIDNDDGRRNSNDTHIQGGRIALRFLPLDGWTIDATGAIQSINEDDSHYITRIGDQIRRPGNLPEPHDNDFRMAALKIAGHIGSIDLLSATSVAGQETSGTLDASAVAAAFGLAAPLRYSEVRTYSVINQEFRLSQSRESGVSWVAGLSWVKAESQFDGKLAPSAQPALPVVSIYQESSELSAFADLSLPLDDHWKVNAGGRLFRSIARDERADTAGPFQEKRTKQGFTPSLGLSWEPARDRILFLRLASAMRPGGLSATGTSSSGSFDSDELTNLDLGWRMRLADSRLSIEGAGYLTFWDHIQSDYLLANGLVGTHNAGNGRIFGVENTLRWRPGQWTIDAGFTLQQARLVKATAGTVIADDGRLPVVPDVSMRLGLARHVDLGQWHGDIGARAILVGASRLSFDQGLDRHMGDFATLAGIAAFSNGTWTVTTRIDNAFNAHGDSFALGNPFSIRLGQQSTPVRPRMISLGVARRW